MRALKRPLTRKVEVKSFRRPLIFTVTETGSLGIREARSRRTFWTTLAVVFYRAVREQGERDKTERLKERAARNGGTR